MSISLQKTPEIIQHVQRLNQISIKQNLASEYSQIQGIYTIEYDSTDEKEAILVTETKHSNFSLTSDKCMCLKAGNGMLLIDGQRESQNWFSDILTVFSPAGFQLGNVRRRGFDLYSQYDIYDGNMKELFHLKSDPSAIVILNHSNTIVATVNHNTENATFDISYQLEISAIEKFLILICVLMWTKHEQLYNESQDYCCRLILRQLTLFLISCIP
ncbi:uncharacterized protein LOC134686248 [Mytilus trossulus]|uniref:uncharacterized protein LOC134686248 n=1 Tax=Mytilus trossulus TaxID=6551 RepID=UPI003007EF1D